MKVQKKKKKKLPKRKKKKAFSLEIVNTEPKESNLNE